VMLNHRIPFIELVPFDILAAVPDVATREHRLEDGECSLC
jgi:hypothetical protein